MTEAASLDARLVLETPSAENLRPCAGPARLPRPNLRSGTPARLYMSRGDVERFWSRDRRALVRCAARKAAVQRFYADRDARIAGAAK